MLKKDFTHSSAPVFKQTLSSVRQAGKEKLNQFVSPMLASLHDKVFDDDGWIFEIKWDGYRAIAEHKGKTTRLYSRNGLSYLRLYPKVAEAIHSLPYDVIFDGEIVALNKDNKPDFQKLQQYGQTGSSHLVYYIFDCLYYNGKDLTKEPLLNRKKILESIIPKDHAVLRYSDHVLKEGKALFKSIADLNLEGIIAKKADSIYTAGKRSKSWLKIKHHNTQEAIIVGFSQPKGSRSYIGSLVLAVREGKELKYIGNTGTGFTQSTLKILYDKLQPLITDQSPFKFKVPEQSKITWVKPKLICALKFTEITNDGILRHPVYQGLREDKTIKDEIAIDRITAVPKGASNQKIKKKVKSILPESLK